jgi:hypothetical protein
VETLEERKKKLEAKRYALIERLENLNAELQNGIISKYVYDKIREKVELEKAQIEESIKRIENRIAKKRRILELKRISIFLEQKIREEKNQMASDSKTQNANTNGEKIPEKTESQPKNQIAGEKKVDPQKTQTKESSKKKGIFSFLSFLFPKKGQKKNAPQRPKRMEKVREAAQKIQKQEKKKKIPRRLRHRAEIGKIQLPPEYEFDKLTEEQENMISHLDSGMKQKVRDEIIRLQKNERRVAEKEDINQIIDSISKQVKKMPPQMEEKSSKSGRKDAFNPDDIAKNLVIEEKSEPNKEQITASSVQNGLTEEQDILGISGGEEKEPKK